MKQIGIPQALLYHRYSPAWKTFFQELDYEVIESDSADEAVVDKGVRLANDEACFPVKLFLGHVEQLRDKVDYIFIPRVVSVKTSEFLCPKFMGLPEVVSHNITNLPPLLTPTVNLRDSRLKIITPLLKLQEKLNRSYWQIIKAAAKGWYHYKEHCSPLKEAAETGKYKIGLLGHEYIIYDPQISMDLIDKLKGKDMEVITADMLSARKVKQGLSSLSKDMFWTFNKEMLGAAYHFFNRPDIDGIIQLTAFGCGPDSLVGEMIEREAKDIKNQPFMALNLDEHTGEAGLNTRLEAFVDMLKWQR
jgi:predicted nucleotide-binding protein (sugar kinase/HSP70/actin superfamily)